MLFSLHFKSFVCITAEHFMLFSLYFKTFVCIALGVFIVCYLAYILSHLFALQPSTWSVHFMLFSLHFKSFVCITAEHLECSFYVI